LVDGKKIVSSKCLVKIWCGVEGHDTIIQKVIYHLNRKNVKEHFCPECEKERLNNKKEKKEKTWKHNLERFIKKSNKVHGEGTYDYSLIQEEDIEYVSSVVEIVCNRILEDGEVCGHIFPQKIWNHIRGTGCPNCFGKNKYTLERFIERANRIYTDNEFSYHLIQENDVENSSSKVNISCNICEYVITPSINNFLNSKTKKRCPKCNNYMNWTKERLKEECENKSKEGYIYDRVNFEIDPERASDTLIPVGCQKCKDKGYKIYYFNPSISNHFNKNSGCPRCSGTMPWNYERFLDEIPNLFLEEYDYSKVTNEMITNAYSEIPIIHNKCGQTFKKPACEHLLNMKGCSFCSKSNGSQIVYLTLKNKNIIFKDEFSCPGLNGFKYFYDYLILYKYKIYILEYDGRQHMIPSEFFGGEETFEEGRERDIYKHALALQSGINIIRIDYTFSLNKIEEFIIDCLEKEEEESFSNPEMYNWLLEGVKNHPKIEEKNLLKVNKNDI